jgi:outer membrane lipoprotein-sorting protein
MMTGMSTTSLLRSRRVRWAVPAVAVAAILGVGPLVDAVTASAHGSLPPRTAAQLLVDVHDSRLTALSGTVVETTDLGLPALPSIGGEGGDAASFSSLVSGSHTMRVWYDGPSRVRLALLGQLGESDLVRNGTDLWSWSSKSNTATHWTLPSGEHDSTMQPGSPTGSAMTPQAAAEAALKAIDPSTRVSTDPTATVAGRPAYLLSLVPRDSRSLVGSVRIAIDGKTHIPTRVQLFARGASSPAFQVGFTSFSTSTPAASVFGFKPPPGATVKQGEHPSATPETRMKGMKGKDRGSAPDVVGKGWTSVLVSHVPTDATQGSGSTGMTGGAGGLGAMLSHLPTVSGSWGSGHLLRSAVFSAVLTDDGRIAVGAVPPQLLYDALARR